MAAGQTVLQVPLMERSDSPARGGARLPWWPQAFLIAAMAFAVRLVPTLRGGGLYGLGNYDDGVHLGGALALIHGRLPYREFLFLHPPGILLMLAPFGWLASWIGEPNAMAAARLAWMALGAMNALLIARLLMPWGRYAAFFGGLTYALIWPAMYAEHTALLEGPGNTCLLLALLLLAPAARILNHSKRRLFLAGLLLGVSSGIKIWAVVPWLLIACWLWASRNLRQTLIFLAGTAAGATLICLPFFVVAPRAMWRMVVPDQVGRPRGDLGFTERLNGIVGLDLYHLTARWTPALTVALVIVLAAVVVTLLDPRARLFALLFLALTGLLLVTPSWLPHYACLTGVPLTLVLTVGAAATVRWLKARSGIAGTVAGTALVVALLLFSSPLLSYKVNAMFPGQQLATTVEHLPGCITTDEPTALIEMNVFSQNLERDCRFVLDLGGVSYDLRPRQLGARKDYKPWQAYALTYFRSGEAMISVRFRRNVGFSPATATEISRWPVIVKQGSFVVRRPPALNAQ